MRNLLYKFILPILTLCMTLSGCVDSWTETDNKIKEITIGSNFSEEYYAQLRAYKKTDHAVAFGWFGNWTGKGASLDKSMAGIPDSVDFISIWGNWRNPSEAQLKDLRFIQQKKGTKALLCFIVANLGDQLTPEEHKSNFKKFWGWNDGDAESIKAAIEKYANAICDTIDKYQYDGFDLDYEPHYGAPGNIASDKTNMITFLTALSKRVGPMSGTGRYLVVDGEPQSVPSSTGPMFNYFIVQAYHSDGDSDLDTRLNLTIKNFEGVLSATEVARKYIVTENFEDLALSGGANYIDRYGNTMKSVEGMARWNPIINGQKVRKGGIGTYHMEYEYHVAGYDVTYPFLRNGIHIMNPDVK